MLLHFVGDNGDEAKRRLFVKRKGADVDVISIPLIFRPSVQVNMTTGLLPNSCSLNMYSVLPWRRCDTHAKAETVVDGLLLLPGW